MLDMGFKESIEDIVSYLPKKRQTLLFSATYPKAIQNLSRDILKDPHLVEECGYASPGWGHRSAALLRFPTIKKKNPFCSLI